MTTAKPQQHRRPPRPTIDDQVQGHLTAEEYRAALRWAAGFRVALLAVLALLVVQVGYVGYVVAAQLATQTSLIRPLTQRQKTQLDHMRGVGVTLTSTADMRPAGWAAKLPAALMKCGRVPTCPPYLNSYARYLLRTSPDAIRGVENIQKTGGAALLVALFALFALHEARQWPVWERREMAMQTRRKLKTRR